MAEYSKANNLPVSVGIIGKDMVPVIRTLASLLSELRGSCAPQCPAFLTVARMPSWLTTPEAVVRIPMPSWSTTPKAVRSEVEVLPPPPVITDNVPLVAMAIMFAVSLLANVGIAVGCLLVQKCGAAATVPTPPRRTTVTSKAAGSTDIEVGDYSSTLYNTCQTLSEKEERVLLVRGPGGRIFSTDQEDSSLYLPSVPTRGVREMHSLEQRLDALRQY